MATREFFPRVKKTVMPRPATPTETDVLGHTGSVPASAATIYGSNWYHDTEKDLIEIYDAGPALVFREVLPRPDKYRREGLYLHLSIAYRTTAGAQANIRTFSGNHVTLPNSLEGSMFDDVNTFYWVTDDMTLNVNSIFHGEKLWIQRVDWEWMSREVVYYDEIVAKGPYLQRTPEEIEAIYGEREITPDTAKEFLLTRIREDDHFAKRCLALLATDKLLGQDLVQLYRDLGVEE